MRVLVCAATKHGATEQMARRIADRLSAAGLAVDVRPPSEVTTFLGYGAVILGSAVYAGRWLRSARVIGEELEDELTARRVWLFSSGPVGDPPFPTAEPEEPALLGRRIGAVEHRVFPGKVDPSELGFGERLIVRAMRTPDGDYRDWDALDEWADGIAAALAQHTAGHQESSKR